MVARIKTLLLVFLLLCASMAVSAPPPGEVARIGLLEIDERYCRNDAFIGGLKELGYIEGKNVLFECRHASGRYEDLPRVAQELVNNKPDVIVPRAYPVAEVAKKSTRDIPIVTIMSGDPVAAGWATNLARPESNVTGLTYFTWELYAKRLELLKAAVPGLKRVGLLMESKPSPALNEMYLRVSRAAARELGLEIIMVEANDSNGIKRAFETMAEEKIQAVHILGYLLFHREAQLIADLALWHKLPTMHFMHEFPSMGGLMGYGPDYAMLRRRLAVHVDKILNGARPADLPIEQPTQLLFSVNLATARELGLTIPPLLLLRADKVIE